VRLIVHYPYGERIPIAGLTRNTLGFVALNFIDCCDLKYLECNLCAGDIVDD